MTNQKRKRNKKRSSRANQNWDAIVALKAGLHDLRHGDQTRGHLLPKFVKILEQLLKARFAHLHGDMTDSKVSPGGEGAKLESNVSSSCSCFTQRRTNRQSNVVRAAIGRSLSRREKKDLFAYVLAEGE